MKRLLGVAGLLLMISPLTAASAPLVRGLKNPAAVATGSDGRVYVTTLGEIDKDGDGAVVLLDKDKAKPFAEGLDDPRGLAARAEWLYVVDKNRVWRINRKGKAFVFAAANAFTPRAHSLRGIDIDEKGTLYVSDAGEGGKGGAIYRIDPRGKVSLVSDAKRSPALKSPTGLVMDGLSHVLAIDSTSGYLSRLRLEDGGTHQLAEHFGSGGLVWDKYGRLYGSDGAGRVFVIPRPGEKPLVLASDFQSAAGLGLAANGKAILVA
ncbi:MAG: PQQ-dependent sugar dehydrogenase, partial [Gemmataceae bacterium]